MTEIVHKEAAVPVKSHLGEFSGRDLITLEDYTVEEIERLLTMAEGYAEMLAQGERSSSLTHRILATLFHEPSTRTRLSFESAMQRLGGGVISVANAPASSSVAKGESLPDTVRIISNYADAIVLRHPEKGAAKQAADASLVPIINAGDGTGHHPTQALVDLYTIKEEKGHLAGLKVALVGDLRYGRTVHSLAGALGRFRAELVLVAPPELSMPGEIVSALRAAGTPIWETQDLWEVAPEVDVLYVTRIQRERFADPWDYEQLRGCYRVDLELVAHARREVIIMHPLPRVDEIDPQLDGYDGAAYFRQSANGLPVRMALLAMMLGGQ